MRNIEGFFVQLTAGHYEEDEEKAYLVPVYLEASEITRTGDVILYDELKKEYMRQAESLFDKIVKIHRNKFEKMSQLSDANFIRIRNATNTRHMG